MRQKQDKSARHRVSCGSVLRIRFTRSLGVKSRYLAGMKLTVFYDYSRHGPVVERALRSIASRLHARDTGAHTARLRSVPHTAYHVAAATASPLGRDPGTPAALLLRPPPPAGAALCAGACLRAAVRLRPPPTLRRRGPKGSCYAN